jgi:alginate O-acetyltransferase complex protein AlgJ
LSNYKIELAKLAQQQGPVKRWWLDFPLDEQAVALTELTNDGLTFQGWVLLESPAQVQVYLKQGSDISTFTMNTPRPDVVQAILKQHSNGHPQLHCGFRFSAVMTSAEFELGVVHNGKQYPLLTGTIVGPFKVLAGKDNWLFLDNDTNNSVEQFTGKILLDSEAKQGWKIYMDALVTHATALQCRHVLLLAPAKEAVYAQFHPYTKAAVTPVEQVLALAPGELNLCYPQQALALAEQRSFRLTDTHWSPYGAMLASVELAVMLGFERDVLCKLFSNDTYRSVQISGDLGNKVFPPLQAEEQLLKNFSYRKCVVSDNGLANFGRTVVLEYTEALQQAHLVIFGASSSYSMLDFLCRIFSRITFMHTAGNIDPSELRRLAPDYLVCQTNARYVIRAPRSDYNLTEVISSKK